MNRGAGIPSRADVAGPSISRAGTRVALFDFHVSRADAGYRRRTKLICLDRSSGMDTTLAIDELLVGLRIFNRYPILR